VGEQSVDVCRGSVASGAADLLADTVEEHGGATDLRWQDLGRRRVKGGGEAVDGVVASAG
jgi:hypothetical protein